MKEAAGDVEGKLELTRSSGERLLEVHHQSDRSVHDRCAVFKSGLVNQSKEALVDGLVRPLDQTVQEMI